MNDERLIALVDDLRGWSAEADWFEFKHNNSDPKSIGKRISALANAARLADHPFAYMVWGIRDDDHNIVGTDFDPAVQKEGNQPVEFWLAQQLKPSINFSFKTIEHPEGSLILLEIPAATTAPVEFNGIAYIRIGSATPKLSDYPERQKALWERLRPYAWETGIAAQYILGDEILTKLDYAKYFELTEQRLPDNREGIFEQLTADRLITKDVGGRWNITNLGAVLLAKDLSFFGTNLERKGVRFVVYSGKDRTSTVSRRVDGKLGYAAGFEGLIDFITALLPVNEEIGAALREKHPLFPTIALRELIANALIHQDMTATGAGPSIELFTDRIEITNPGEPLVHPERFIDAPPRSRNEALAALMRRMRICEEQGSGIDKSIAAIEMFQLPPPDFQNHEGAMRVIMFGPRKFAAMTTAERIRACYQHAVLKYVSGDVMKNASLRERFGVEEQNASQISQVINAARDAGQIKSADPERPRAGYKPFWA